jgi:UDP-glucuronate 4-epimerase
MDFIRTLEEALGRTAEKEMCAMQPGDVSATWADTSSLEAETGYRPDTPLAQGIDAFVQWYRAFYQL